jgi:basic membrane protein A
VLVLVPGNPWDGSWSEAATRAAQRAQSSKLDCSVLQSLQPEIEPGWDLVLGHGTDYGLLLADAAKRLPHTRFVVTDDVDRRLENAVADNLTYVDWRWDEGAFLAGILASLSSRSGRIAYLGGVPVLTQRRALAGFVRGATAEASDVTILGAFAGTFHDSELGRRLGGALLDEGADVLFHTADRSGSGAIQAVQSRGAQAIGFMNSGESDYECMIGYLRTDVEGALLSVILRSQGARAMPRLIPFGFASGYQTFWVRPGTANEDRLRSVEAAIRDGRMAVR